MENENLGHGRGKIIEELLRGRDLANQLRQVMNEAGDIDDNNNSNNNGSTSTTTTPFAEHLLKEVLMTFTNSLLFLKNPSTSESFDVSDLQLTKSEDSLESNCKSSIVKERRGCYKRRKILQTWEKESEFPVEDGHQWRKYGQKKILHNDFPRNYFRCTHKHDQGCKATKQVQKIKEEPPLHKTTYYGHHTCKIMLNPEIIVDSLSPSDQSSMFLSFDNSFPTPTKQDCPFLSSSVKRECKKEDNVLVNLSPPPPPPPSSSNNDYLSELTFDESSTLDSDHLVVDIPDILYGSSGFDEVLNWNLS